MDLIKNRLGLILIFVIWFSFSYPVFLGKTPFPSDYQVNFFIPWASYPEMKGPVKNNAQPDIVGQIYPWRYYSIDALKHGRIPFWNPYSFAGSPHLANYQSAVLFPLNILFFLPFKFIDVWSFLVILQPLLAGIFMYLLARALGISRAGSTLSSTSFMFCGFLTTWMGYATLGYAILPLPFAIYCIVKFIKKEKLIWLILFSLTFPFSFFAGHFQTSIYFAFAVILFILYCLLIEKERKKYLKILLFFVFGILLTMPQVLPSLEFYTQSVRSSLFQNVEAIPPSYISTFFSPDFFGNPVTRNDWFGHYAEWNGFTGFIALSFAWLTVVTKRSKKTYYFIILLFLSLLLAFKTPILELIIFLKIPVISTSAASRIIVLFSFSCAILSGFGIDIFFKKIEKRKIIIWLLSLLIIVLISFAAGFSSIHTSEKINIALKNSVLPIGFLFLVLILSLIKLFDRKRIFRFGVFAIIIIAGFEMYRFSGKWQNFDLKDKVFTDTPVINFLKDKVSYNRTAGFESAEVSVFYKIPVLSGYDPLYISSFGEFSKYVENETIGPSGRSAVLFPNNGKFSKEALDFLGVKYIVYKYSDKNYPWAFPLSSYAGSSLTKVYDDKYFKVFKNNNSFDRAFLVSGSGVIQGQDSLEKLFKVDLKEKNSFAKGNGNAKIVDYEPEKIVIKTEAPEKAQLVLTDPYYPGWSVSVNGKKENVMKAYQTFREVEVPKGTSIVEFSYKPSSFFIGTYAFLIGILGIIVIVTLDFIRVKK